MRTTPAVAWQRDVPESIRSLGGLDEPDYVDLFTATTNEASERPVEDWARIVLDLPVHLRFGVFVAQRLLLGLRLGPRRSPDYIQGWKIAARGEDWVRIEAASWMVTGSLVLKVDGARLYMATFFRYDRRVAALVWPPISIAHRKVGLALMRRALNVASDDGVSPVVWQRNVPEPMRSLAGLANPDYEDLFTATTNAAAEKTAEDWARAVLEGAPYYIRLGVFAVAWRLLLGLRLGPRRSPDFIEGWKITARGEDWVRIEVASWMMTASLVFKVDEARLSWASFARYDRRMAALGWPLGSIVHRKVGLALMRRALRARVTPLDGGPSASVHQLGRGLARFRS